MSKVPSQKSEKNVIPSLLNTKILLSSWEPPTLQVGQQVQICKGPIKGNSTLEKDAQINEYSIETGKMKQPLKRKRSAQESNGNNVVEKKVLKKQTFKKRNTLDNQEVGKNLMVASSPELLKDNHKVVENI